MSSYLPLIYGPAGALVVLAIGLWLFLAGKIHSDREFSKLEAENDRLRDAYDRQQLALEIERRTVNETAKAGTVNNQLITALVSVATGSKPKPAELTAEDLGL